MFSVRFSRTAAVELVRIADQSQPTFFEDLDEAIIVLSEIPYSCPALERNIRLFPLRKDPFNLLYRILDNTVLIVRVMHSKRKY